MGSLASSCACVPVACTRPSSKITIWSASMTELTRCAMITFVTSRRRASPARMRASVAVSTALVESSNTITLGCAKSVRAMHRRCFCPPETLPPP